MAFDVFRCNAEGNMRDDVTLKKALDTLTAHRVAAGMPVPSTGVALYLASDQDTLLSQARRPAPQARHPPCSRKLIDCQRSV